MSASTDVEESPFTGDGGTVSYLRPGRQTADLLETRSRFWREMAALQGRSLQLGHSRANAYLKPTAHRYFVVAGRPGMFKTTLAWTWAVNLATAGKRVLWLGVEMLPQEQVAWTLARWSGISLDRILRHATNDSSLTSSEEQAIASCGNALDKLPMVVWPHTGITLDELHDSVHACDYDAVFLDYVQIVKTNHHKEYDQIRAVSQAIQHLTRSKPVLFVALAQMNREIERGDGKSSKPRLPQLSDLKGAGQIEQDADAVCFLHRMDPSDKTQVDLRIVKNRYGEPDVFVPMRARPEVRTIEEEQSVTYAPTSAPPPGRTRATTPGRGSRGDDPPPSWQDGDDQ